MVVEQWDKHLIKAQDAKDAIRIASKHYELLQIDGNIKQIDPESAWRNHQKALKGQ